MMSVAPPEEREALVLIHGLFGWGVERPLYGYGPSYFPLTELNELWSGPVIALDVAGASSGHDRACEAFAQLTGRRTGAHAFVNLNPCTTPLCCLCTALPRLQCPPSPPMSMVRGLV